MTEGGRPIVFRVVLIAAESPVSPPRKEPVPLEPIMRYLLGQSVPFNEGELRRLAPVADPRRVLIAVEQAEGNRLRIYGLVDVGMALWEMARHERVMGTSSPEALVVSSTRPGELIIARGDRPVLRLRGGKIETPAERLLFRGHVGRFFANASDELIDEAVQRLRRPAPAAGRRPGVRSPRIHRVRPAAYRRAGPRRGSPLRAGARPGRRRAPGRGRVD